MANMRKLSFLSVLLLQLFILGLCDEEFCRQAPRSGRSLVRHSFKMVSAHSVLECILKCSTHRACLSVNIKNTSSLLCELNDKSRKTHPQDFKVQEKSIYVEILRETFEENSDSHCPSGLYCHSSCGESVYECRCSFMNSTPLHVQQVPTTSQSKYWK